MIRRLGSGPRRYVLHCKNSSQRRSAAKKDPHKQQGGQPRPLSLGPLPQGPEEKQTASEEERRPEAHVPSNSECSECTGIQVMGVSRGGTQHHCPAGDCPARPGHDCAPPKCIHSRLLTTQWLKGNSKPEMGVPGRVGWSRWVPHRRSSRAASGIRASREVSMGRGRVQGVSTTQERAINSRDSRHASPAGRPSDAQANE